jgi:hypothetical protein
MYVGIIGLRITIHTPHYSYICWYSYVWYIGYHTISHTEYLLYIQTTDITSSQKMR